MAEKKQVILILFVVVLAVILVLFFRQFLEEDVVVERNKAVCIDDKLNLCKAVIDKDTRLCNKISVEEEREECVLKLNLFWAIKNQDSSLCDNIDSKIGLFCKVLIEGGAACNELDIVEERQECIDALAGRDCSKAREDKQEDCREILASENAIITNDAEECNDVPSDKGKSLCQSFITKNPDFCKDVAVICENYDI